MEEKFGIENLKLLIGLPIAIGMEVDKLGHESGKTWTSYFKIIEILPSVVDVIKVDWKKLKEEFKDLSEVEKVELKNYICEKFSLIDQNLEAVIERSLDIILSAANLVQQSIDLVKSLKK